MQRRRSRLDAITRGFGSRGRGDPSLLSTAASFRAHPGQAVRPGELGGYHVDFRFKARKPKFPPPWLRATDEQLHVATAQWGLGCYERYLAGEGEEWLAAAVDASDHLLGHQQRGGPLDGAFAHGSAMPHTYRLPVPWFSAMAQGEAASLFVRAHRETEEERFADAALRSLGPLDVPVAAGGVLAELGGGPFYEEYPTMPHSYVLNGALFAIWGCYDVAVALGDGEARGRFDQSSETLADGLGHWDLGFWSLYDLFPHPVANVASEAYHVLHVSQLHAMQRICERPEFGLMADRWARYRESRVNGGRAFARKVAFRLLVPRNRLIAHRLPWSRR